MLRSKTKKERKATAGGEAAGGRGFHGQGPGRLGENQYARRQDPVTVCQPGGNGGQEGSSAQRSGENLPLGGRENV